MDDMQRLTTAACADLERLAAAAATMGYSSDAIPVPAHHISNAVPPSTAAPSVVPQYADAYDLSRAQQYAVARLSEYQPRTVYEQPRSTHAVTTTQQQQQQHVVAPAHSASRGSQYGVVDRSNFNEIPNRSQQYGTLATAPNGGAAMPGAVQYSADAKPVNVAPPGAALSQAPLLPTSSSSTSSLVTQAVTQALMYVQEGIVFENSGGAFPQPQEKKKKKEKKPQGEAKEKKEKDPTDCDESPDDPAAPSDDPKVSTEVPEPVLIDGRKYYLCNLCDLRFLRKYLFKRHLISHSSEKRGALSLETKVEIIRRIQSGEKQVDLAMEYNVGRSTLSFIMKHSEKFLSVWKNGKFHPESKRLRGAQREDVEEALYEWYKQAMQINAPVTGPILCRKAKDFAVKLGYKEFKATHGWLDRFKHRKSIVLGRGKPNKDKENQEESEDLKGDFAGQVLPSALVEYEANDVFHADETGLLYRILPNKTSVYKSDRCAGGSKSKHRVTVLMCTNMTGTEKFPLLVIGKHPKPKCFKNVKSLPVQYLANPKAWMTMESFLAWLHDLDSWFVQQNRKVLLILPNLPIHPKSPKLNAVRIITSPNTFIGPYKLGVAHSLKRNYRRAVLETLLNLMDEDSTKKKRKGKHSHMQLNLLSCLHLLAAAWHAVTDVTINNSFQRSGIGKYAIWGMNLMPETNLGTENLELLHKLKSRGFKIPDGVTFDEFVTFDDDVQVCHLMDDEDIIAAVTGADVESSDSEEEVTETDNKTAKGPKYKDGETTAEESSVDPIEVESGPAMTEVDASLGTLRQHIQYQEGAQEMFRVLAHLEFLIHKGTSKPPIPVAPSEAAM